MLAVHIACDDPEFRSEIEQAVRDVPEVSVIDASQEGPRGARLAAALQPDVVVVGLQPDEDAHYERRRYGIAVDGGVLIAVADREHLQAMGDAAHAVDFALSTEPAEALRRKLLAAAAESAM